jgi:hypothetical protein
MKNLSECNMSEILDPLQIELAAALRGNDGNLGKVFALLAEGVSSSRELVERGAAANTGAASNLLVVIRTITDGVLPKSPSRAAQARRSIGGILRDNPNLSDDARGHLENLREKLEVIATDSQAIELEDKSLERASIELEKSLEKLPGVYVFTLPSFYRTVQKTDPDRYWFKVGKTDRAAGVRIGEQMRATGLPEDPWIARVYRHETRTPREVESEFHNLLAAAGHVRAAGKHSGREWYATNLEFLDAIGSALGCEISENQSPDDL